MRNRILRHQFTVLSLVFAVSRLLVYRSGIRFNVTPIYTYWQYLDVVSLQHQLLKSVWYLHSQPPVFNLLAGAVLKLSGEEAPVVFHVLWPGITFLNAVLLLKITRKFSLPVWLPLLIATWYLVSPATILFENELFYTSFSSLLLLLCVFFLQRLETGKRGYAAAGFFLVASLLCLTRSLYHLVWLAAVSGVLLFNYYRRPGFRRVVLFAAGALLLTGSWYLKNLVVFGTFTASSWTGINLSRIVFHDKPVLDSGRIEAIHPFYPVSYYKRYLRKNDSLRFAGKDDRVLLREKKSDSAINMNHVSYIRISEGYGTAARRYIRQHPMAYLKNVGISAIIFFTPASSYFQVEANDRKMAWYDVVMSWNFSHFLETRQGKKKMLALCALPEALFYLFVFAGLYKASRRKPIPLSLVFITGSILFVFITSSLLEYGENMRFRYELEPLFLILAGWVSNNLRRPV